MPNLPAQYADLITIVADSKTYTPFYQAVEVNGDVIIKGIFNSDRSWKNIMRLNPDFGAMHGYFSFKAEEAGAKEVVGLELKPQFRGSGRNADQADIQGAPPEGIQADQCSGIPQT